MVMIGRNEMNVTIAGDLDGGKSTLARLMHEDGWGVVMEFDCLGLPCPEGISKDMRSLLEDCVRDLIPSLGQRGDHGRSL